MGYGLWVYGMGGGCTLFRLALLFRVFPPVFHAFIGQFIQVTATDYGEKNDVEPSQGATFSVQARSSPTDGQGVQEQIMAMQRGDTSQILVIRLKHMWRKPYHGEEKATSQNQWRDEESGKGFDDVESCSGEGERVESELNICVRGEEI
ncbi:hypothetical protein B0H34DRAFT_676146 [Crassisporium funariophilum]|nr:hypothetical protein B0H34DRAFT_676146 [Crassisporium funariophilum]